VAAITTGTTGQYESIAPGDHGAKLAARSRAAQQLPDQVEDDVVLARVAQLIRGETDGHVTARAS
jgi:hypothetical protein